MKTRVCFLLALLFAATGCTHVQLRRNTSERLRTVSEITQQQILDNVAAITVNRHAWPEFTNLSGGTSQVADSGSLGGGLAWNATTIVSEGLDLGGSRGITQNWDTTPLIDSARLLAMWSAYHYSVYGYAPVIEQQNEFGEMVVAYSGENHLAAIFGTGWKEILPTPGWFCMKNEKECRERFYCGCVVGRHCDRRVCVKAGGQASLQRLTFVIMYIANIGTGDSPFPTGVPSIAALTAAANRSAQGTAAAEKAYAPKSAGDGTAPEAIPLPLPPVESFPAGPARAFGNSQSSGPALNPAGS